MSEDAKANEEGFNQDELKDIMDEIENLEQEFSESEPAAAPVAEAEPAEVEASAETVTVDADLDAAVDEIEAELDAAVEEEEKVVSMPSKSSSEHVEMWASGEMNFKMNYHGAELSIDEHSCLNIHMNGVVIKVDPEKGCSITMSDGINFNIPNKKAA